MRTYDVMVTDHDGMPTAHYINVTIDEVELMTICLIDHELLIKVA
jgi:hypothetical protein